MGTRQPSYKRQALVTLVLTLLPLAAACGDDDDTPDETLDTTTSSEPEPTTTTTVAAKGQQEWVAAVQDLYERWSVLLKDPDPDRVSEVYAETCECWDTNYGTVEFLASSSSAIEGPPTQVLFVHHEQTNEQSGLVHLTVKLHQDDLRRVDSGEVVEEIPADGDGDGSCAAITIRQDGPGDAWRIYSELTLTGCPPEAD